LLQDHHYIILLRNITSPGDVRDTLCSKFTSMMSVHLRSCIQKSQRFVRICKSYCEKKLAALFYLDTVCIYAI